jgi:glutamate-1-semialdehyde aminotransferase
VGLAALSFGTASIAILAEKARSGMENAFTDGGFTVRCTGRESNAIPASSMAAVQFPHDPVTPCDLPEQTRNPDVRDVELADTVLQLALLLEDVFVMHGLGAVSAAHTGEDVARLEEACRRAARRIKAVVRD